jgi:hypothetical protein
MNDLAEIGKEKGLQLLGNRLIVHYRKHPRLVPRKQRTPYAD